MAGGAVTDLDAIRIYADPTLTPREKIARITGVALPDQRLALAPSNTPEARPDASGVGGAGNTPPPTYPAGGAAPSVPSPGGGESTAGNVPANAPPTYVRPPGPDPERTAPPVEAPETALFEGGPAGGSEIEPVDPGDFRAFARRSLLLGGAPGAPPKPTEQVREETQMQAGGLSPEAFAELLAQQELADWHTMQAATKQAGLDAEAGQIRLAAEERAQQERMALETVRSQTLERVARLRERQNEISEQIAATDPVEPSLWAGKSFGEKLLTALSVGMVALGAGAARDPKMGAETIRAMANREVDRQARFLAAKRGQLDALGTVLERHMANFGDVEIAKRAAIVDILGKAEFEVQRLANDPRNAQIRSHALMAQAAELRAQRQREQAALQTELGNKVTVATARQFVRERLPDMPPPVPPVAQPGTGPAPAPSADQQLAAELDAAGLDTSPVTAEDKAAARAAGFLPERGGTSAPAPAPTPTPKGQTKPVAARAPAGKAPAGKAPKAEERIEVARRAFAQGRFDLVERALTDRDWQAINVITKRYKQAGATGSTSGSASEEEARAYAIADYLGMPVPSTYVPASARSRLVKLPDGSNVFATSESQATRIGTFLPTAQAVFDSLNSLVAMADVPGRGWTPEMKSRANNTAKMVMYQLSNAMDQGVVREGELPIWNQISGGNMADYIQDPRYNAKEGIKATIAVLRRRFNRELGGVTLDPFGERQYKPAWAR